MDNEITIFYIYGLEDPITNEIKYIGQSINPKERYIHHLSFINNPNLHFVRWLNKLKNIDKVPILKIIDKTTDKTICNELEKYYISKYPNLVNIHEGGTGGAQPYEIRQKVSEALKGSNHFQYGIPRSLETKQRISNTLKGHASWNKGKHHSLETRQKMSLFWKGKTNNKWSKESREKARINTLKQLSNVPHPRQGKHHTTDVKQKLSLLHKGKHHSEETKKKISIANKGKKRSKETCLKISDGLKGKPKTEEHRRKLSISRIMRFR